MKIEHIRSFMRREGRITNAQRQIMKTYWHKYVIEPMPGEMVDFNNVFTKKTPLILEIGFGNGNSLLNMAKFNVDRNFVGIEVYKTGIAKLIAVVQREKIDNIRMFCGDAVEVLENHIADSVFAAIQILFPDPWPKARHHKRRLIQPDFIALLARKLIKRGVLSLATDCEDYAIHMRRVLESSHDFIDLDVLADRQTTKFEKRGQLLGHRIWDLVFEKV